MIQPPRIGPLSSGNLPSIVPTQTQVNYAQAALLNYCEECEEETAPVLVYGTAPPQPTAGPHTQTCPTPMLYIDVHQLGGSGSTANAVTVNFGPYYTRPSVSPSQFPQVGYVGAWNFATFYLPWAGTEDGYVDEMTNDVFNSIYHYVVGDGTLTFYIVNTRVATHPSATYAVNQFDYNVSPYQLGVTTPVASATIDSGNVTSSIITEYAYNIKSLSSTSVCWHLIQWTGSGPTGSAIGYDRTIWVPNP